MRLPRLALAAATTAVAVTVPALATGNAAETPGTAGSREQAAPAAVAPRLQALGTFRSPVHVTGAPGDPSRLFVVEQDGRIRVLRNGRKAAFLDIAGRVRSGGEQGLLSVAFSPNYARNRLFYVYYTGNDGDNRVAEFRRSPRNANRALPASGRTVLRIRQPQANHNGGQLAFGPDGLLYIATGDGGGAGDQDNHAQNRASLLGKILRINPARRGNKPYTVPRDNPFVGGAGRDEIYAYGLRNPWRFSFDRRNGDLVIADVGQDRQGEINFAARGTAKGANYGWRVWEGTHRFASGRAPGAVFPVKTLPHSAGYCAVVGGFVVRDPDVPELFGRYVYGDLCRATIRSVVLASGSATADRATGLSVPGLVSFGEDSVGHVYAVSQAGAGRVYRIV